MAISSIVLRCAPAAARAARAARAVANRTVSLKPNNAHGHGHGKLFCQEICGNQYWAPTSSRFFSSSSSKSKKQKEKVVSSSSSDSDEDSSDFVMTQSDLSESDYESDHGNSEAKNSVDVDNQKSPDQAPESEPTMAILDIIGSKLQSKSKPDAEKYSKVPFGIEFMERSPTLILKRNYGNEEITVGVNKYALDGGKDLVPLNVSVTKKGGFSLHFGANAFPEKLEITSYLTSTTDARGVRSYEEPPFSEISRSNLFMNFMEYLNVRGINPSTINAFRADQKEQEPEKDSLEWMKNLKKFMEM